MNGTSPANVPPPNPPIEGTIPRPCPAPSRPLSRWLRNPLVAVLGALILGATVAACLGPRPNAARWAFQAGFVFFLLHSLRWHDAAHAGAEVARRLAGFAWVIQSYMWINTDDGRFWMPIISAVAVLVIYSLALPCQGIWRLFTVPAAALMVILTGPCAAFVDGIRIAPIGVLAVIASFLLLGAGTIAALTRKIWHEQ